MKNENSTAVCCLVVGSFCIIALALRAFFPSVYSLRLSVPTIFLLVLISLVIKRLMFGSKENLILCSIFSGIIFALFSSLSGLNRHSAVIYFLWGGFAYLISYTILFYAEKRNGGLSKAALFVNSAMIFLASQIFEGLI